MSHLIEKHCAICGKAFKAYPSEAEKKCCSKKCGAALRTRNGKRGGTHWSEDARTKFRDNEKAKRAREISSRAGLAAANALPESQRGAQNREALVWLLIDPNGNYHEAVNLLDWARRNKDVFFAPDVPEDIAAMRISSGFRAIASSMRGVSSRKRPVQSYKGWSLARLPCPQK